jgi:outer membrane protein TolC
LPLWRWGHRAAVQQLASSAVAESEAARDALRLEVAGLLRGALWDIEAAAVTAAAAEEQAAVAARLLDAVERRHARGDLALADVLLAGTARLEREQAVIAAHAELVDAERAYHSLTGLDRRPAGVSEVRSARSDFDMGHPLLALANAEVERARANVAVVDREARGNPTIAFGPRRQRDPLTDFYTDSVAVAVRVPVGGRSHAVTQRAAGARAAAQAEAARGALLRRLELDLHEATHGLLVLDESLELAAERRELADRQWQMAQSAFEQGEIELRELLRIQETAQAVSREAQRLAVERQRTIAAYNQAVGETP